MKAFLYLIILSTFLWYPTRAYSQLNSNNQLNRLKMRKHPPLVLIKPNTTRNKQQLEPPGIARRVAAFPLKMPVLKDPGNAKIRIARLDSVFPYHYNMPVKRSEMPE